MSLIALIDSDLIAYRIAFACKEESVDVACRTVDRYVTDILLRVDHDDRFYDRWQLYLTGSNNFRLDIAKTAVYKGNRTAPKPPHHKELRQHLVSEWGAVVYEGIEADDAIATDATKIGDECIMASVDKDFDQIKGWHYNFVKHKHYYVDEPSGTRFFYRQILTGDAADNIIGLRNIGNKRADVILGEAVNEEDLYNICVEAYDGDEIRVIENARLLWLRRYENQLWEPPHVRTK
jgi:DNA polymerase-1